MTAIRAAVTNEEVRRCLPVLRQLRPDLTEASLVAAVARMKGHGFSLIYATDDDGVVRAVAGYRVTEMLRTGTMLEIDDLVTDETGRSRGYGRALFEWLTAEARRLGCSVLELDSGVQRERAHRFYFREGMHILGYHFSLATGGEDSAAGGMAEADPRE